MYCQRFFRPIILLTLAFFAFGCGSTSDDSSTNSGGNPDGSEVRLEARGEAVIAGVEAELRGHFERRPDRTRLDGELENINLPVGSAISFCLVQGGNTIPLAVGIIRLEDLRREADFHIRTDEGRTPPNVQAGDVLQARDGANGNSPDCSRPLLVAGTFVVDNSSASMNVFSGGSSGNGSGSGSSGSGSSGEFRLRARGERVINGREAELRAQFRRRPDRTRLDGELEDINLPLGTRVSFCLVRGGTTIPLAVGRVHLEAGRKVAEFSIRTDDGERPPNVVAGNVLQSRNGANGSSPNCGRPLLVSGRFVPDN